MLLLKAEYVQVVATMSQPAPSKYTEEYFAQCIQDLLSQIKQQLPSIDPESQKGFTLSCQSFQDSKDAKTKAQNLHDKLVQIKADDDIIQQAKDALDAAQKVFDQALTLCSAVAYPLLKAMDLATIDEDALLQCTVLTQATPKGLANFCALDPEANGPLVDYFLARPNVIKQMMLHGGAKNGNYGSAFTILQKIDSQLPDDAPAIHHRIALATALELATPKAHFHSTDSFVCPMQRFWHYVHAYEKDELDDAFETLSTWELRMVVDCDSTDDELQWGRDYLKAYRPDEVLMTDEHWRYCYTVRTDLGYRHPDHEFNTYPAMLSAGGECGPRAFFGRFICKAFGIPTWGVRQQGHAAMSRWTDKGWIICLGAAFKYSWWPDGRYQGGSRNGPDFVAETQARAAVEEDIYYHKLTLLECVAEVMGMGEAIEQEVCPEKMWRSLALMQRKLLADTVSEDRHFRRLEEEDETLAVLLKPEFNPHPCADVKIDTSGMIIIPASSFTSPSKPSKTVSVIPSFLGGGNQLHLEADGTVEYTMPEVIPNASFMLSCRLVNVHEQQVPLLLTIEIPSADDDDTIVDLYSVNVEYTVGAWNTTKPLQVHVGPKSILKFSREPPCHGLSIKDFSLDPC
jgi:hypothetical protein